MAFQVGDHVFVANVEPWDRLGLSPVRDDSSMIGESPRDMFPIIGPPDRHEVRFAGMTPRYREDLGCKR